MLMALAVIPGIAAADQITLTSPDNTVRLTGNFIGFEQDSYVIDLKGHEVRVPIVTMNCEGADCLGFSPLPVAVQVGG
ncbi:hypothetical protein [Yoonia sp. 2307UL14-13]|uniref:hypothetical protein n=1 Tax=Yoonia sp. 2307UL14-13 TaxID=3126506 RepID=UPI0030ADFE95